MRIGADGVHAFYDRETGAAFVLEGFTGTERAQVPTICEQAADATELLVELGLEAAQNRVHAW